ncbi:MAG: IS66 family insertion sequence element accessory protein TnpB [Bradymonadaceae bacterium]|nr:IS66 family insertion sequence element accessory protein TnpB [Lujinxingiaceae bacterium]
MLSVARSVRIFLAAEPVDLRNGIDGLGALVKQYGQDPFAGHLFVFVSKRRDRLKILAWDTGGFIIFYKRLEKGRFKMPWPKAGHKTMAIDAAELHLLLDGIDFSQLERPELWQPCARDFAQS